jgi:carbon monoxide dehydrogenase subunit G
MRFEENFQVPQGPQQVFDYLADVCNEAKWNPWAISVEKVSEGPIGKGARFRGRYKRIGTAEQWLSDYIPAKRLVYKSHSMDGSMTFDMEPEADGTKIRLVAEAHPQGLMKLMAPLMTPMMRGHIHDLSDGLKRELGR